MHKPTLTIEYCPKCGWLMRSAWMAQEFLTTFSEQLGAVTLKPSEIAGAFKIYANENVIFDRKRNGGFEDIKVLKQIIRDALFPDMPLGHSDRKV